MNRLWIRLTLAFVLVTMVTLGIVAVLINLRASEAFRLYLSYSEPSRYQPLVEMLGSYYVSAGSWDGVSELLDHAMDSPMSMMTSRPGFFPGGEDTRLQVVLADSKGVVLYDRVQHRTGRRLTKDEAAAAVTIQINGEAVGKLVVAIPVRQDLVGPLEQRFFVRVREMLLAGAVIAGLLGVLLGLAVSRTLSAPLQRLALAARAVANRDFGSRVEVGGSREVAEVGQAFNEMTAALDEGEQLRRNLMADVAHELRTPLSVVQGNLQAILDDVYPMDKSEISRLYDETRLLSRLVEDLRQLALADAGKLQLNTQPVDLGTLIHTTCDHLTAVAEAQRVTLTVDVPAELPLVVADSDRVAQVLHNLLANAFRFTQEGGRIDIAASAAGDDVQVTVADTGKGIAPEDLEHIFDRFWKADRARAKDEQWPGGTGLGLSIAQSMLKAQGGKIWVESIVGEGSRFHFTLPRMGSSQG
jgi:two-component system OmpR family sensor kinase/two-component system sensor histidine kinase BaeS